MRKFSGVFFAAVIAVFTIMLGASAAQAYPAPGVTVHVNPTTLVSGHNVAVDAHSTVTCQWTATFAGQTKTGSGKHFQTIFKAPKVQQTTTYPLVVTCNNGTQTTTRTTQVTVLAAHAAAAPAPSNNGVGALPNTGGPSALLLGAAGALIAAGAGTLIFTNRRRRAAHV